MAANSRYRSQERDPPSRAQRGEHIDTLSPDAIPDITFHSLSKPPAGHTHTRLSTTNILIVSIPLLHFLLSALTSSSDSPTIAAMQAAIVDRREFLEDLERVRAGLYLGALARRGMALGHDVVVHQDGGQDRGRAGRRQGRDLLRQDAEVGAFEVEG